MQKNIPKKSASGDESVFCIIPLLMNHSVFVVHIHHNIHATLKTISMLFPIVASVLSPVHQLNYPRLCLLFLAAKTRGKCTQTSRTESKCAAILMPYRAKSANIGIWLFSGYSFPL